VATRTTLGSLSDPAIDPFEPEFGYSVAVSGTIAVVGAVNTNPGGAVYIYLRGKSGWSTTPATTLFDPDAVLGDAFGSVVAISGTTILVGAFGTNSSAGAAYIYVRGKEGWPTSPTAALADPGDSAGDEFGISLSLSGANAVIGAFGSANLSGAAYIYTKSKAGWPTTPTTTLANPGGGIFGESVAISDATVMVGAPATNSYAGVVFVYLESKTGWPTSPTSTLFDPGATNDDQFGNAVAISGVNAVIGAFGTASTGVAYVFTKGRSGWAMTPVVTLADPGATVGDNFANSVAISGATIVIGAPSSGLVPPPGSAYIYVKGEAGWPTDPTATPIDPASAGEDGFGLSVAALGKTVIVGAFGTNSFVGTAYLYRR
jgi:hypothetical protein